MRSIFRCASSARTGATALLMLFVCLPLVGSSEESDQSTATIRCIPIEVFSPQSDQPRWNRRFAATGILDLEFRVHLWGDVTGAHRIDLKLYTPDGQLYQTLTVPFRVSDGDPATGVPAGSTPNRAGRVKRKLSDYPQPIEEVEISSTGKGWKRHAAVSATLPVAGTSIVWSSLYGRWTAEAFLDGALSRCGAPARFSITE
jgi:hypothetical protein